MNDPTIPIVVTAARQESVSIEVQPGAVTEQADCLIDRIRACGLSARIVVDSGAVQHNEALAKTLECLTKGIEGSALLVVQGGERAKTMGTLRRIIAWLDSQATRRRSDLVIGIGGGAVLDTLSLAAALYRRGVDFWRIPTTLLSAIDAGLGAKSAVNFYGRKNLVGTYRLPRRVIIDPVALRSISGRQLRSGLAEAIKLGLAADAELFRMIEEHSEHLITERCQSPVGYAFVRRAISSMLAEVSQDLWEDDLVHPTDLGHSFSRIMEQVLRPRPLHGEAVAMDIAFSFACSVTLRLCEPQERLRCIDLLQRTGLPVARPDLTLAVLQQGYDDIVVHRDSELFPLPVSPGNTVITQLQRSTLVRAISR